MDQHLPKGLTDVAEHIAAGLGTTVKAIAYDTETGRYRIDFESGDHTEGGRTAS